jgi:hypothetical protein
MSEMHNNIRFRIHNNSILKQLLYHKIHLEYDNNRVSNTITITLKLITIFVTINAYIYVEVLMISIMIDYLNSK